MKKKVFAILPRSGLANRLFVWAKAFVFSKESSSCHIDIAFKKKIQGIEFV